MDSRPGVLRVDGGREGRGEKREAVWEEEVEVGKEGEKEREKER